MKSLPSYVGIFSQTIINDPYLNDQYLGISGSSKSRVLSEPRNAHQQGQSSPYRCKIRSVNDYVNSVFEGLEDGGHFWSLGNRKTFILRPHKIGILAIGIRICSIYLSSCTYIISSHEALSYLIFIQLTITGVEH